MRLFDHSLLMFYLLFFCVISPLHSMESQHVREEKPNMIGLFLGGTNTQNRNFFTYGLEYHHVMQFPFGFSFVAEDTPNNIFGHHEGEVVGLVTFNFFQHMTLGLGPGVQVEKGAASKMLGRISLGYVHMLMKNIELTPSVDYNWVSRNSNKILYGITLGKQF